MKESFTSSTAAAACAGVVRASSAHDETMQRRAFALWKTKQFDTVDIAESLGLTEAEVCAAIWRSCAPALAPRRVSRGA